MKIKENIDWTVDENTGLLVLTKDYLYRRGYCCGSKCRNCVYEPKYQKGTKEIDKEYKEFLEQSKENR